ncbi:hypothetical protein [Deinococcus maricopensis]|uniref:Uncharacterized protein n=1 Tax=Deinococcus maricopensis (strain DSM 21211 / LMG 22137 / NRRL B-23946 / LB-34) TaxID=709986 RepID=E8U620_DEIML|nr:hypothetical protein [Deinococcus maricopensis]ADV66509.1 hypothetical protein Deima_0854 [Deinococcus maricopensis DSM 21211]
MSGHTITLTVDRLTQKMTSSMGNGTVAKVLDRPHGLKVMLLEEGGQYWCAFSHTSGGDDIYEVMNPGIPVAPLVNVVAIAGQLVDSIAVLSNTMPLPDRLSFASQSIAVKNGDIIEFTDRDSVRYAVRAQSVTSGPNNSLDVAIQFI